MYCPESSGLSTARAFFPVTINAPDLFNDNKMFAVSPMQQPVRLIDTKGYR